MRGIPDMSILRYVKGAALLGIAACVVAAVNPSGGAFAGTPEKQPTPVKPPTKESVRTGAQAGAPGGAKATEKTAEKPHHKTTEKKCSYTTQECLNYMAVRLKDSGWIGIEYDPEKGNEISRVIPGSPAEKAGLTPGDRLVALNGVEIKPGNQDALAKARKEWTPGQTVHYTVKHGDAARKVDITLAAWPADVLARYIGEHMLQHAEDDRAALDPKK